MRTDKKKQLMESIGLMLKTRFQKKLSLSHGLNTGLGKSGITYSVSSDKIIFNFPGHLRYLEYGTPGRLKAPKGQTPKPNRKMPVYKVGDEFHSYLESWGKKKLGLKDDKEQFALAKHIQMYGTKPYPFIRTTIKNDLKQVVLKALSATFR